jgi:hypothetical protein
MSLAAMIIEPAEIFKVLSVETRVKIIELLKANGALGVKEQELNGANLELLKKYEIELQQELELVRERVKKIEVE